MQELPNTQVRFLGQEDLLEEGMATHLPGQSHGQRIPGRLESIGS